MIARVVSIAKKIEEQSKDVSFLSEIVLPEEDLEFIRGNLSFLLSEPSTPSKKIVAAFALVDVAIRRYDGTYWGYLEEEASITIPGNHQSRIHDLFSEGLELLGWNFEIDTKRRLEKILIHTLVPDNEKFINNFFDFISKYYKKILSYDLPENPDAEFKRLSEYVKFQLEEPNVGDSGFPDPRVLNKCTQYALTEPDLFKNLLMKILTIIDEGYRGYGGRELKNNRFQKPFKRWYSREMGSKSRRQLQAERRMRRPKLILTSGFAPAISIPELPCLNKDATIEFKIAAKSIRPEQPQIIEIQDGVFRTLSTKKYLLSNLDLSPFDKFRIFFDEKLILNNRPKRDWIAFDENLIEVPEPASGDMYILFKDKKYDLKVGNEEFYIERVSEGVYQIELNPGSILTIQGEKIFIEEEGDEGEDKISVRYLDGVTACDDDSTEFRISKVSNLRCRLYDIEKTSSVLVKIVTDGNEDETVHLPLGEENENYKFDGERCVFSIDEKHLHPSESHRYDVSVYVNEKKRLEETFLIMPDLEFSFDTHPNEIYQNAASGNLTIFHPIEKEIRFSTSEEKVSWSHFVGGLEYLMVHSIPSILISHSGGEDWLGPGEYDVDFNNLYGDSIKVRCGKKVRLYVNKGKAWDPLPKTLDGKDQIFNILELRRDMTEFPSRTYVVDASVESKPRFRLMEIFTSNKYSLDYENGLSIYMEKRISNPAVCYFQYDRQPGKEVELTPGNNSLIDVSPMYLHIRISEVTPSGISNTIIEERKGEYFAVEETDNGFMMHYNEFDMLLCEDGKRTLEEDYDSKSRFNPWMRQEGVKRKIFDLIKRR